MNEQDDLEWWCNSCASAHPLPTTGMCPFCGSTDLILGVRDPEEFDADS